MRPSTTLWALWWWTDEQRRSGGGSHNLLQLQHHSLTMETSTTTTANGVPSTITAWENSHGRNKPKEEQKIHKNQSQTKNTQPRTIHTNKPRKPNYTQKDRIAVSEAKGKEVETRTGRCFELCVGKYQREISKASEANDDVGLIDPLKTTQNSDKIRTKTEPPMAEKRRFKSFSISKTKKFSGREIRSLEEMPNI